jgi:UDP-3-O-[3-hydroxymyristoyl] glucosamine N-acyltransferase
VIAPPELDVGGRPAIRSAAPSLDFARAVGWVVPGPSPASGVHPTAVVAADARVDPTACVGAHVVVGPRSRIGARSVLHPCVVLYEDVTVGEDCALHAGAILREDTLLGDRVVLQPGAVIGGDGFGYEFDEQGRLEKVPQIGRVVLEDDVEIGANTTVDRARLGTTRIARGVKIDNLVQVGHNCEIGAHSAIVAQTGLAGGSVLGERVFVMAQAGVSNRARVGDGSFLGGRVGVFKDLAPGSRVWGFPAIAERAWHRSSAWFARLPELARRLREVERRVGVRGDPSDPP